MKTVYQLCFWILIVLTGCQEKTLKKHQSESKQSLMAEKEITKETDAPMKAEFLDSLRIREYFEDSTRIGCKGRSKIVVALYDFKDTTYIGINFYSKRNKSWKLRNKYRFDFDLMNSMQPVLTDLNGDGLKDIHLRSMEAVIGANQMRRLFVYSVKGDSLVHLVNSHDYPNVAYNPSLKCLECHKYYSASNQAFGRIQGDSIIDFAYIENRADASYVFTVDQGQPTLIYVDSSELSDPYARFKNYKPLVRYRYNPSEYTFEETEQFDVGGTAVSYQKWKERLEI
ncbi:hypothetical protein N9Y60_03845 [Crocinitomicaceae bacterium]|nr:hypothetical protein [Crocinitomicaceae bacterium]MDB3906363.1 hypothetical protein [Crocinitomicaceae bacterium]MDC0257704.1 hypothetical protein [Crocinitomicaceae bacterium]